MVLLLLVFVEVPFLLRGLHHLVVPHQLVHDRDRLPAVSTAVSTAACGPHGKASGSEGGGNTRQKAVSSPRNTQGKGSVLAAKTHKAKAVS